MDINFIIPAIDLIEGKCVRLSQGNYDEQKIYRDDPVETAIRLEQAGFKRLHLVDLDGARSRQLRHLSFLEAIASKTNLQVDFGGGINDKEGVRSVLDAGAYMVTIGSLAVKSPGLLQEWINDFGADHFFIGADVKDGKVKIHGWQEDGGLDLLLFVDAMIRIGVRHFFCTDISKDGMLAGPALLLYGSVLERFPGIQLTASGGVSCDQDLHDLHQLGCTHAIVGKALYERKINLVHNFEF